MSASRKIITLEKRLESQVKLHLITVKAKKIICFIYTKISAPVISFFELKQNFMDQRDPYQSLTHATHKVTHLHYPRHPHYLADSEN